MFARLFDMVNAQNILGSVRIFGFIICCNFYSSNPFLLYCCCFKTVKFFL